MAAQFYNMLGMLTGSGGLFCAGAVGLVWLFFPAAGGSRSSFLKPFILKGCARRSLLTQSSNHSGGGPIQIQPSHPTCTSVDNSEGEMKCYLSVSNQRVVDPARKCLTPLF